MKCLALLSEYGADLDAVDAAGRSPLHVSAAYGCYSTLKFLLESAVDSNLLDFRGHSALHLATKSGHHSCGNLLLSFGSSPSPEVLVSSPQQTQISSNSPMSNTPTDIKGNSNSPVRVKDPRSHMRSGSRTGRFHSSQDRRVEFLDNIMEGDSDSDENRRKGDHYRRRTEGGRVLGVRRESERDEVRGKREKAKRSAAHDRLEEAIASVPVAPGSPSGDVSSSSGRRRRKGGGGAGDSPKHRHHTEKEQFPSPEREKDRLRSSSNSLTPEREKDRMRNIGVPTPEKDKDRVRNNGSPRHSPSRSSKSQSPRSNNSNSTNNNSNNATNNTNNNHNISDNHFPSSSYLSHPSTYPATHGSINDNTGSRSPTPPWSNLTIKIDNSNKSDNIDMKYTSRDHISENDQYQNGSAKGFEKGTISSVDEEEEDDDDDNNDDDTDAVSEAVWGMASSLIGFAQSMLFSPKSSNSLKDSDEEFDAKQHANTRKGRGWWSKRSASALSNDQDEAVYQQKDLHKASWGEMQAPPTDSELNSRGLGFNFSTMPPPQLVAQDILKATPRGGHAISNTVRPPTDVCIAVAIAKKQNTPRGAQGQPMWGTSTLMASSNTRPQLDGHSPSRDHNNSSLPPPAPPQSQPYKRVSSGGSIGGDSVSSTGHSHSSAPPTNGYSMGHMPVGVSWRYVDVLSNRSTAIEQTNSPKR